MERVEMQPTTIARQEKARERGRHADSEAIRAGGGTGSRNGKPTQNKTEAIAAEYERGSGGVSRET